VCHSPFPLYRFGEVNRLAEEQGLSLDWDPAKLSCIETNRKYTAALTEVRAWIDDPSTDPSEIVVLFMDTKWLPPHATDFVNGEIIEALGDILWTPGDGNPMNVTIEAFRASGKRIMIEGNGRDWAAGTTTPQQVFYPTFWSEYQFGDNSMAPFPDCSFGGDRSWWGTTWVRALGQTAGSGVTEGMTRCGVPLTAGNYVNPDDMRAFVWSWAPGEPKQGSDLCASLSSSARWVAVDCTGKLPVACGAHNGDDGDWVLSAEAYAGSDAANAVCPGGYSPVPPRNGYSNTKLWLKALGQRVWINAPLSF